MKVIVISGFFNPLHGGHLDMVEDAAAMGDKLVVIVNNDEQQMLKKGKIILDEENRMRLMRALRDVDDVILSIDKEPPVIETLKVVAEKYRGNEIIFANGGDRDSGKAVPETPTCKKLGIEMVFEAGGNKKYDSSTRINRATGHEVA